jgi:hypothetical protein
MQIDIREIVCGAAFIVIAALFALGSMDLSMGSAIRMGPGYFPLMLAMILGVLGLLILIKGLKHEPQSFGALPWRGLVFILAGPIVFGLTVRGLGLVPSIALVAAIATLASARSNLRMLAIITVVLTLFCVVVFSYGLGLPYARFGPWVAPFIPGI